MYCNILLSCLILLPKEQSITGSVFVDLKEKDINTLGFNFGSSKILQKVLSQVIYMIIFFLEKILAVKAYMSSTKLL